MQYVLALVFFAASLSHAMDEKEFTEFNKKYCQKGVFKACETLKCMENKEVCIKNKKPDHLAETQRKVVELKCGNDQECWMKEAIEEEKRVRGVIEPLCDRGAAEYCYEKEILDALSGSGSQD